MTMIITHGRSSSRVRPSLPQWLSRVTEFGSDMLASWRRRQALRALESLPAETLKDIGWPTSDTKRMRIAAK